MKRNLVYLGICIMFFILYFKILGFIWNKFIPFNTMTDIIALFIIIAVIIPLSVFCTEKIF